MKTFSTRIFFLLIIFWTILPVLLPVTAGFCETGRLPGITHGPGAETPNLQWFRQELKIDPKYLEHSEGILGMGWAHFLLMVFLVIFFFGALIAYHRHTTRTARILERLLKED